MDELSYPYFICAIGPLGYIYIYIYIYIYYQDEGSSTGRTQSQRQRQSEIYKIYHKIIQFLCYY
ncbi:hypothetical protein K7X86_00195 [Candidatus Sulcia muelleri]|nr:hypothetical protein [Candidatus Karelsulcia muelleri]